MEVGPKLAVGATRRPNILFEMLPLRVRYFMLMLWHDNHEGFNMAASKTHHT
jgi:hypothetical protein